VISDERNLLVGAPTGAGKTVVGDAGINFWVNNSDVAKVYYTTPIKALSNQKFNELIRKYGADKVGLVTGDTTINSEARIVVMTTEVLRNQVYSKSTSLNDLKCVVMDEIHFLGDLSRGSVWEEILIHLPKNVQLIGLSATVSNIEEFAAWLEQIRGNCEVILTEKRPVPLEQHMILSDDSEARGGAKVWDIYDAEQKPSAKLAARMMKPAQSPNFRGGNRKGGARRGVGRGFPNQNKVKGTRRPPKHEAVILELQKRGMLPAIYFIFSRAKCDEALGHILNSDIVLVEARERDEIEYRIDEFLDGRATYDDLSILGFYRLKSALLKGIGVHHAGMIPVLKELVEFLFEKGLLKVVFATETLALGINMPARSVVIESIVKFNGIKHVKLTPGQFTQLTGRAGRRGLDTIGHAVVVDEGRFTLDEISRLSSRRLYPLVSAFNPNYNMVANLATVQDQEYVETVLNNSYKQYQINLQNTGAAERVNEYDHQIRVIEKGLKSAKPDSKEANRLRKKHQVVSKKLRLLNKEVKSSKTRLTSKYNQSLGVLQDMSYLKRHDNAYELTDKGDILRQLYCENELTLIEILVKNLLDDLSPAEIAAVLSSFISVSRKSQEERLNRNLIPHEASTKLGEVLYEIQEIERNVKVLERRYSIDDDEDMINFGLLKSAYLLGANRSTEQIVAQLGNSGIGDFVRMTRGIMDLINQIDRCCSGLASPNMLRCLDILKNSHIASLIE
jgi:ATP-dependent RNA helicase HelY